MKTRLYVTIFGLILVGVLIEIIIFTSYSLPSHTNPKPAATQHRHITVGYTSQRRLGNLMFDYASMLGIARDHNVLPVMPRSFPAFDVFELKCIAADYLSAYITMPVTLYETWGAGHYHHITYQFPSPPYDVILKGFFQSWKYFDHIAPEIKSHFTFKRHIQQTADKFLEYVRSLSAKNAVIVGVHIRRGDILTAKDIISKGYTTPGLQYYHNAMLYFRKKYDNVHFILCTDSSKWTLENFAGVQNVTITSNFEASVDLAILASCDHVIISVGTFGWWAAWLANGTTIYSKNWAKPGTFLHRQIAVKDYFPPHWIPML